MPGKRKKRAEFFTGFKKPLSEGKKLFSSSGHEKPKFLEKERIDPAKNKKTFDSYHPRIQEAVLTLSGIAGVDHLKDLSLPKILVDEKAPQNQYQFMVNRIVFNKPPEELNVDSITEELGHMIAFNKIGHQSTAFGEYLGKMFSLVYRGEKKLEIEKSHEVEQKLQSIVNQRRHLKSLVIEHLEQKQENARVEHLIKGLKKRKTSVFKREYDPERDFQTHRSQELALQDYENMVSSKGLGHAKKHLKQMMEGGPSKDKEIQERVEQKEKKEKTELSKSQQFQAIKKHLPLMLENRELKHQEVLEILHEMIKLSSEGKTKKVNELGKKLK
jgi:hypothetical protein